PSSRTEPTQLGLHNTSFSVVHVPFKITLIAGSDLSSLPLDLNLRLAPELLQRIPRPVRPDAGIELLRRHHRLVPERHPDVLDRRAVVLEPLGEARPEDLVVRIDPEAPEHLVPRHPPARLAVVAALLVREQGLHSRRVD